MPADSPRTKVAILGGGVGAITAAFELTDPSLNGRYDVTVYQLGWRLEVAGLSGTSRWSGYHTARYAIQPQIVLAHELHIWLNSC